jgi:hypothetical protein
MGIRGGFEKMQWFRVYSEIIDDPKMAKMNDETFRVFIYLLAVASEEGKDGEINMTTDDIAWRVRIPAETLNTAIKYLSENNIVQTTENKIIVTNWKKRQFSSDNVSERVKRFRNKQCNVSRNVSCNVIDTDTDTDTDTEKRRGKKNFSPPSTDDIMKYCRERNNAVDPQMFMDFYTAKNWMIGKNKMKDWKAAVRTWESRNGNGSAKKEVWER